MTESELIIKALEDAYTFVKKQERTPEKDELLINLFKAKILVNNLTIQRVSQQRERLIAFLEMNNWFSLEDKKNAEGVVDCYLKAINCG